MSIDEIRSAIEVMERDALLYDEQNFEQRIEAIDFIEFHLVGAIEALLHRAGQRDDLIILKHRAEIAKTGLTQVDTILFQKLRETIRVSAGAGEEFRELVFKYFNPGSIGNHPPQDAVYDNLDIFINQLIHPRTMPEQTKDLEPGMVFYQKTPSRNVFKLAEKARFTKDDVFVDIGSGLGQAAILINLLTGVTAKGIEFEPAFCAYAQDCASALNLSGVTFINGDARQADYSEGTVFFMYTPFIGGILQQVLELLRLQSLRRKIRLITYGPCTAQVALQSWLEFAPPGDSNIYKLAFFNSF